ncbi:MAG: SsrA-binding protein SmpB [Proteobacteria bacterium]|jgi:SsrA-binding protein|nr:SsrA-binding protein SmpB [Pseudomonadota bacterium]MDA0908349.1 SsrA-binding protein SmpB [Pseudomonadota bacterium]NBR39376.1 SsrA-binding protein SmpB [Alphaproteobacteria bacterium]
MASTISVGRVAENRKARHDYEIIETIEAGLVLFGSEVKSLRRGRASITEAYAGEERGRLILINANIPEYEGARDNHEPKRHRPLLLNKKEQNKLLGHINRDGMTIVPLSLYFNDRGLAKVALGLAKGRKKHDKREAIKKRDWDRQKARVLKGD